MYHHHTNLVRGYNKYRCRSVYVLIPFGDPVRAEDAGIIPAGNILFSSTFSLCTGFGKSRFPRDFTARERKSTGNQTLFPRQPFGWERDIKIYSGTVWMWSRERYVHGNGKRNGEKKKTVKFCGNFPARSFRRMALVSLARSPLSVTSRPPYEYGRAQHFFLSSFFLRFPFDLFFARFAFSLFRSMYVHDVPVVSSTMARHCIVYSAYCITT